MARSIDNFPEMSLFLAGLAAGVMIQSHGERSRAEPEESAGEEDNLKKFREEIEARLAAQEAAAAERSAQIDARLEAHAARLKEMPSTADIVSAMEHLLGQTSAALDRRMNSQANSMEILKTTVSQTDSLLERVLESLDGLQNLEQKQSAANPAAFEAAIGGLNDRLAAQAASIEALKSSFTGRLDSIAESGRAGRASEEALARTMAAVNERLEVQAGSIGELRKSLAQKEEALSEAVLELGVRLSGQANSIERLSATVSQTDSLLERVLETLDQMQGPVTSSGFAEEELLH